MSDGQQPLLHSIWAAASRLGVSESTIWRLIRQGKLQPTRILGRTLLSEAELQRIAGMAPKNPTSVGESAVRLGNAGSDERLQRGDTEEFD
jgi:excisionase family DNA binding protein